MTSESNACQLVGQPLRSHGNHNGHDLLCQQQREQIDGGRRSTQCHSGGLSTLEDLAPPRPRPRADSHQSQKQQHMHRRVKRFGWRSSCYATAAALKDEDRTRTSSCVALYTKGLHMFRMGDRELKGAEPVLTSFQRSHSPMNPADDMASKPRKRTSGLKASSASPRVSFVSASGARVCIIMLFPFYFLDLFCCFLSEVPALVDLLTVDALADFPIPAPCVSCHAEGWVSKGAASVSAT